MAVAIDFYNKKNYPGFEDCEETIKFTILINNLFDSLNRKFPAEGIRENSNDLEVFRCCMMHCMFIYILVCYYNCCMY